METKLNVGGMTCSGCEESVGKALGRVNGVRGVDADHKTGTVVVRLDRDVDRTTLEAAVTDAGYNVLPEGRGQLPMTSR